MAAAHNDTSKIKTNCEWESTSDHKDTGGEKKPKTDVKTYNLKPIQHSLRAFISCIAVTNSLIEYVRKRIVWLSLVKAWWNEPLA